MSEAEKLAAELEKVIKKTWPDAYVRADFIAGIQPSVSVTFAVGKDASQWSNNIIHNDPGHTVIVVSGTSRYGITTAGEIEDTIEVERIRGGGIMDKSFSTQKVPFRRLKVSPDQTGKIVKTVDRYFKRLRDKYEGMRAEGRVKIIESRRNRLRGEESMSTLEELRSIAEKRDDDFVGDFRDLPKDLTKLTTKQAKRIINYLAKKPLKDLRRRQDLLDPQRKRAYDKRDDFSLDNIRVRTELLRAAIDKKVFGESCGSGSEPVLQESLTDREVLGVAKRLDVGMVGLKKSLSELHNDVSRRRVDLREIEKRLRSFSIEADALDGLSETMIVELQKRFSR